MTVQETKLDQPGEGVAVIGGEPGLSENSSEMKLLREESRGTAGEIQSGQLVDHGVMNPITEEENYPDAAAPYLVSYICM
jgi:hypothetical protein